MPFDEEFFDCIPTDAGWPLRYFRRDDIIIRIHRPDEEDEPVLTEEGEPAEWVSTLYFRRIWFWGLFIRFPYMASKGFKTRPDAVVASSDVATSIYHGAFG